MQYVKDYISSHILNSTFPYAVLILIILAWIESDFVYCKWGAEESHAAQSGEWFPNLRFKRHSLALQKAGVGRSLCGGDISPPLLHALLGGGDKAGLGLMLRGEDFPVCDWVMNTPVHLLPSVSQQRKNLPAVLICFFAQHWEGVQGWTEFWLLRSFSAWSLEIA